MTDGENKIPKSIGIIMDGNRRWAKKEGLSIFDGHKKGYEKFREVLDWAKEAGIKNVFVYAFSSENWNRAKEEVSDMMKLLRFIFSSEEMESLKKENVQIKVLGDVEKFPEDINESIKKLESDTKDNDRFKLGLCLSYGGRAEILNAVNKIVGSGKHVSEEEFSNYLWSAGMADPDLIIRTSGEMRLSGFLPWQSVYSELFFIETLWPAFSKEEFQKILSEYSERDRRNGK